MNPADLAVANELAFFLYKLGIYKLAPTRDKMQLGYMKILAHEWVEFKIEIEQGEAITEILNGNKKKL
jgi:hypothetical protein